MKNWKSVLVKPDDSIIDILKIIDEGGLRIALVTDNNHKLLGTVTDGDVRRGLLNGISVDQKVSQIMNKKPMTCSTSTSEAELKEIKKKYNISKVPLVDNNGIIQDLVVVGESDSAQTCPIVIMAGGKGQRLRPLTEDCPKALLKVGGKPIMETLINQFKSQGFNKFYATVNYKAEMIKDYFGDGSDFDIEMNYLHEDKPLGTAGSLSLLPDTIEDRFFVINCDLLTNVDFSKVLNFHLDDKSDATMCVREYSLEVPYGVIKVDKHHIKKIDEKPTHKFLVNAGIYVLSKKVLSYISSDQYLDMTDLFKKIINDSLSTSAFPIREYWLDIGKHEHFDQATNDFSKVFKQPN